MRTVPFESPSATPVSRPAAVGAIPLRLGTADLVRLASSALAPLGREARALNVALTVDGPTNLEPVSVDPEKTAWVIAALVGNALGQIRDWRRVPGGDIVVRIRRDYQAKTVSISVADDGPGISPEKIQGLFAGEADSRHGIGLGLTLVKDVAVAHDGSVSVESFTDYCAHGTTVCVTLPAT